MTGNAAKPRAVLFDLLTALIDSWTLWNSVAGGVEDGRRWRAEYLRNTYAQGHYRSYEELVRDAAVAVGLSPDLGARLIARYGELEPWPEVAEVLGALAGRLPLGVVTNCSEAAGAVAVARIGIRFDVVVTAERAGYYKPHPRPYLLAQQELGVAAPQCLFVAGSAYDLFGAHAAGMPVYWHNRIGLPMPAAAPAPAIHSDNLRSLGRMALG